MTEILDDDALMARIQSGDERAFERLIYRWDARIATVIRRLGLADCDLDDVRQDVFVRIFRGADRYVLNTSFRAWINQITLNAVRDCQRKRVPPAMVLEDVASSENDAVEQIANRELADSVDVALQRLPESQRIVLVLRHYAQLTFREISEVLNEPLSTIKSRGQSGLVGLECELAKLGVRQQELKS